MNTHQDILDLQPRELGGVLVCDALVLRDGTVGSNPEPIAALLAIGHPTTLVKK